MDEQGAPIRKPPMEDLTKRCGGLPKGKLLGAPAPEPGSCGCPLVRAELTKRGAAREVPALLGCIDGRPPRAPRGKRRKRWRSGSLGVPDVDRQLRLARILVAQVVEGAAQLLGEGDAGKPKPDERFSDADRAFDDEVGGVCRTVEASRQPLDRRVETAVGRLRRP